MSEYRIIERGGFYVVQGLDKFLEWCDLMNGAFSSLDHARVQRRFFEAQSVVDDSRFIE